MSTYAQIKDDELINVFNEVLKPKKIKSGDYVELKPSGKGDIIVHPLNVDEVIKNLKVGFREEINKGKFAHLSDETVMKIAIDEIQEVRKEMKETKRKEAVERLKASLQECREKSPYKDMDEDEVMEMVINEIAEARKEIKERELKKNLHA